MSEKEHYVCYGSGKKLSEVVSSKTLKFLTNEEWDIIKGWEPVKYVEVTGLVVELQKRSDKAIEAMTKKPSSVMEHFLTGNICAYGEVLALLGPKEQKKEFCNRCEKLVDNNHYCDEM